ncbi:MAG: hypothetical protein ABS92_05085 [Thiobacillus sp. SCN 63-374]|nr:MAG: hypothetical protein ABS92_05085 [Thiobacillus sp. SCN 63-374]
MHDAFFGEGTALNSLWMGSFRETETPPLYVSARRFLEATGLRMPIFTGRLRQQSTHSMSGLARQYVKQDLARGLCGPRN